MKLNILESPAEPWFAGGLQFTCSQCGNCCTGPPGFVWISREEIRRVAKFLGISPQEVVEKYCRKVGRRFSLKERRHPRHGGYDCIFIKEIPAEGQKSDKPRAEQASHTRRICTDTWGCEVRPNETKDAFQPWHWVVIPMMGLTMGEIFYLEELAEDCAADKVYEFFFCGPPLPITKAVGSPTNPMAIK